MISEFTTADYSDVLDARQYISIRSVFHLSVYNLVSVYGCMYFDTIYTVHELVL